MNVSAVKEKVLRHERITPEEALLLCEGTELFELSELALRVRREKNGNRVYYNNNFHIEPTNRCRFNCRFCSYRKPAGDPEAWSMSLDEIRRYVRGHYHDRITEIHLVGGVHPDYDLERYAEMIRTVREMVPERVSVKAFSAIEHIAVIEKAGLTYEEGLRRLMAAGLDTITGGGAEILDDAIRARICPDKPGTAQWLALHEAAHRLGMQTGATMLYGHIETMRDRLRHMELLRGLQDRTGGFSSFIPLKYRSKNNPMSAVGECSIIEDLKTLAAARIFLDNFPHIKAYTPMYGSRTAQLALLFGADDLDGTVQDTTKIYSMAGMEEYGNGVEALREMAAEVGFTAVERDSFYHII